MSILLVLFGFILCMRALEIFDDYLNPFDDDFEDDDDDWDSDNE